MKILLILGIIVAILLMLIVLIQNPKGGGIASNFSAGNSILGVAKTSDIVEKITWGGAILILVISLVAAMWNGAPADNTQKTQNADPMLERVIEKAPAAPTSPATPK
ncbi:MAG: preprotein translocase subunit SecG [Bacteroidetes bacterium]|nr:preprotein translocase subunit SecG [Bacteroidota bacterium]